MTTTWTLSQESRLDYNDDAPLAQFWQQHARTGSFKGIADVDIAYAYVIPDNASHAVVLVNGRVETYLKYKEVMYDLVNNGCAVFTLDHRGQGLSGRMADDPQLGYVEHFDNYVQDVLSFVDKVVKTQWQGDLSLLCHSMGGAVGTLTMLASPNTFSRAVLCSPMYGVKPALPKWFANMLLSLALKKTQWRGVKCDYFFGQKPYTVYPFAVNPLTRSKVRYQFMLDLYASIPQLQMGGVTTQWLLAAHNAMNQIEAQVHKITTPTLILSSGRDVIIDNRRQARVASQYKAAQYHVIDGAMHELFCEKDKYRLDAMQRALAFLTKC